MSERIGIAGGGAIACGLACVAARARPGRAVGALGRTPADRASVEKLSSGAASVGAGNVCGHRPTSTALRDATFVVEAIAEDQDAKAGAARASSAARAGNGTMLATTTSSLSVAALAEATGRPERFVGLHVFNPCRRWSWSSSPSRRGPTRHARARPRAVRGARQDRGRGPRHAGLRRQPPAVPVPLRRRRLLEETGLEPAGDRRLHAARRRPPDGPARAARLRRARRRRSRSARSIGAEVPDARRRRWSPRARSAEGRARLLPTTTEPRAGNV